jgi:hypothetical protein
MRGYTMGLCPSVRWGQAAHVVDGHGDHATSIGEADRGEVIVEA